MRNPALTTCWYLAAILATMFCITPGVTAASFAVAAALTVLQEGVRALVGPLGWQLPLLALIVLVNPLFASVGSTVLFQAGAYRLTLESLAYGLTMGGALLATILWFGALFRAVTQDDIVAMVSASTPGIGLMLALTLRFVGQSIERVSFQSKLDAANTALAEKGAGSVAGKGLDTLTMLLGYVLERALSLGEYMKSLGWGLKPRSSYSEKTWRSSEKREFAGFVALCVFAACALALVSKFFSFYPVVSCPSRIVVAGWLEIPFWALYVPIYAVLVAPLLFSLWEEWAWAHR